jgi:hypothetical protein
VRKLLGGIVAACVLSIGLSGVVAADNTTGQTGHYVFNDSSSKTGANCNYASIGNNTWRITSISARPPSVWWPNTSSNSNTEHGRVGWVVTVKHKHPSATTWTVVKASSVQKKTAYEDHPAYDSADKAPFTRITVSFNGASYPATEQFFITVKVYWYKSNGSVLGTAFHQNVYYSQVAGGFNQGTLPTSYCTDTFNVD